METIIEAQVIVSHAQFVVILNRFVNYKIYTFSKVSYIKIMLTK